MHAFQGCASGMPAVGANSDSRPLSRSRRSRRGLARGGSHWTTRSAAAHTRRRHVGKWGCARGRRMIAADAPHVCLHGADHISNRSDAPGVDGAVVSVALSTPARNVPTQQGAVIRSIDEASPRCQKEDASLELTYDGRLHTHTHTPTGPPPTGPGRIAAAFRSHRARRRITGQIPARRVYSSK